MHSEDAMLRRADRSDALIYTVSTARLDVNVGNERLLRKLAQATGGSAYTPKTERDVIAAFGDIAGKIRQGYTLGYVPTNPAHDGSYRRLIVRVLAPGMRAPVVHVRDGYLAPLHPAWALISASSTSPRAPAPPPARPAGDRAGAAAGGARRRSATWPARWGRRALPGVRVAAARRGAAVGCPAGRRPQGGRAAPRRVIGRIEIPRLGVSTIIKEGEDARTLQLAVGHIRGTALPGARGQHRAGRSPRHVLPPPARTSRSATSSGWSPPEGTFTYAVERTRSSSPTTSGCSTRRRSRR